VQTYNLDNGISLNFATANDTALVVLVASTKDAMASAIKTLRGGASIQDDPAFKGSANRISKESTKAVFIHPGRMLRMAKPFMSDRERSEMAPFAELLNDTVISLVVDHSNERLRVSAEVTGLPKVDALLNQLIAAEFSKNHRHESSRRASKENGIRRETAKQ